MAKGNILKQKDKKKKKEEKTKSNKGPSVSSLYAKVDRRKAKSISGSILLLLSIYLFIAFTSYLFSWKADQNLIVSTSFFDFIFGSPEIEATNWLGKFGAWTAHLFMFNWFGVASFAFSFLLLITGVRLLLNIRILPLRKTYLVTFIGIIWFSSFLGLMTSNINYLGGSFGFAVKEWLTSTLGIFGALLLILVLLFVAVVALFNPDFKAIFQKYFPRKDSSEISSESDEINSFLAEDEELLNDEDSEEDIDDEDLEEEENEIYFKDDNVEEDDSNEEELIENENEESEEFESDDDFEIITQKQEEEPETNSL